MDFCGYSFFFFGFLDVCSIVMKSFFSERVRFLLFLVWEFYKFVFIVFSFGNFKRRERDRERGERGRERE